MSGEAMERELGDMLTSAEEGRIHRVDVDKVSRGVFLTKGESWLTPLVHDFILSTGRTRCVDPFAGEGDMLDVVEKLLDLSIFGMDIDEELDWEHNDSLVDIPNIGSDALIVTNPPFLAKYSAKRKSLWPNVGHYFEESNLGNLYMLALRNCLKSADFVVTILPETFIHSNFSKERCRIIIVLEENPFEDTTFPVCVTCWGPERDTDPIIYVGNRMAGLMSEIESMKCKPVNKPRIVFNDSGGRIGFRAVDGTDPEVRISFMPAEDLGYDRNNIKVSSRLMTYIEMPSLPEDKIRVLCTEANTILDDLRERSHDVILSGFKGNNREGTRRRRLDYKLARGILEQAFSRVS